VPENRSSGVAGVQELQDLRPFDPKTNALGLNRMPFVRISSHPKGRDPQIHSVTPELLQLLNSFFSNVRI
jgi:hypothetical protein